MEQDYVQIEEQIDPHPTGVLPFMTVPEAPVACRLFRFNEETGELHYVKDATPLEVIPQGIYFADYYPTLCRFGTGTKTKRTSRIFYPEHEEERLKELQDTLSVETLFDIASKNLVSYEHYPELFFIGTAEPCKVS